MDSASAERSTEDRPSQGIAPRRETRRRFLGRTALIGGASLAALLAAAGCGGKTSPVSERVFIAPTALPARTPQPAAVPSPRPDPAATVGGSSTTPPGVRPTAVADPSPSPTPGATAASNVTSPPRQPNVLLVTIDTLRSDRIGAYGFARAHTPVLDQMARAGVRFDRAICQLPQTNASHATIMTGEYASTNGVKVHMVDKLKPGAQTIATVMAGAGYQTAGIYSWVSLDPQFCGLNQGFQTYQGYVLNRGTIFSNPQLEQLAHTYRQIKSALPVISTADAALGESDKLEQTLDGRADVTNQAVFNWLDSHAGADPFFLWVHYFDPHYPYSPPAGWDHILGLDYHGSIDGSVDTIHKIENQEITPTAADLARLGELYQGEIAFADDQLGKLFDYLTKLGIADDTIVVVTGDHGESFGEHGDWTHGLKVFETEIRVPLLMRYPRRLPAGLVVPAPAQLIDIMPTVLDLAGVSAKQPVQGTSFLPVITGATNGADRAAFTELADDSFVSVLNFGEWKLIRNNANGEIQLYNLNVDEAEQTNLVKEQPQTAANLSARLQDLMKLSGVTR